MGTTISTRESFWPNRSLKMEPHVPYVAEATDGGQGILKESIYSTDDNYAAPDLEGSLSNKQHDRNPLNAEATGALLPEIGMFFILGIRVNTVWTLCS